MKIYNYNGKANICGELVHQQRTSRRMTQEELAAKMQVEGVAIGREAISRIETGDRVVADYELAALARIFGVSTDWLTENS